MRRRHLADVVFTMTSKRFGPRLNRPHPAVGRLRACQHAAMETAPGPRVNRLSSLNRLPSLEKLSATAGLAKAIAPAVLTACAIKPRLLETAWTTQPSSTVAHW